MNSVNDAHSIRPIHREVWQRFSAKHHLLAVLAAAVLASGCASLSRSLSPSDELLASPIESVGHYGAGVVIVNYTINDQVRGGRLDGWGGGGSMCCVLIPREVPAKPFLVTVKWETNRQEVGERRKHVATVPMNIEVPPGKSGGIFLHFFPGHRVELWVSDAKDRVPYKGPDFPRGPAPLYQPLPDEKPWPRGTTAEDVRTKMAGE